MTEDGKRRKVDPEEAISAMANRTRVETPTGELDEYKYGSSKEEQDIDRSAMRSRVAGRVSETMDYVKNRKR